MFGQEMESKSSIKETSRGKHIKIIKTTLLFLTWISMGMVVAINTGTIPDFRTRMNTTMEDLSYAFTLGSTGALIGSLLVGVVDRFYVYAEAIIGVCLLLSAISNYFVPYVPSLLVYGCCVFVDMLVWQIISPATNVLMLTIWQTQTGSAMQGMQAGFPLGALLGGLVVFPFVSDTTSNNQTEIISSTEDPTDDKFLDDSRIEISFAIGALYTALIGLFHICFQFVKTPTGIFTRQGNNKLKDIISPSKWANGDSVFGIKIYLMFLLFFIFQWSGIKGIVTFLVPYAVDSDLGFTNQEAAILSSAAFAMGGIGRASFVIVARYLSIYKTLFLTINCQLILVILLTVVGTKYKLGLWLLTCCYAFFRDPIWPSGYTWGNNYIMLLAFTLGLMEIMISLCQIIITPILGYLYTNTVIESIFYTTVIFASLLSILLCVMYFVTRNRPGRFDHNEINNKHSDEKDLYVSKQSEISYM